jgi:S1-C subfamily serine protease
MKKKLLLLVLVLTVALSSLSSCMFLTDLETTDDNNNSNISGGQNTIINVDGGPNYENINITSGSNQNLLAASKAMLSAVSVICGFELYKYNWNGSYAGTETSASAGSGVIYKLDKESGAAYIITNNHVLYDSATGTRIADSDISIYLYGKEYPKFATKCELVGASVDYDIAVLRIKNSDVIKNSSARPAKIADSELVSILDPVVAVGNPLGYGISASQRNSITSLYIISHLSNFHKSISYRSVSLSIRYLGILLSPFPSQTESIPKSKAPLISDVRESPITR